MSKLVCHATKFQKSAISKIEGHNERKNRNSSNKDIDWSKTEQNYSLVMPTDLTYYQAVKQRVEQRKNPSGKALRKDAVHLVEFIISSDSEFFENLSESEIKRFFEKSVEYLSDYFEKENVIYAKVHMDEPSKHMHFGFVPMTEDNRVCAKDVISRGTLKIIQDKMPAFLAQCGFDIQRGKEGSKKKHLEPEEYKAEMERQKKALGKDISKRKDTKVKLDNDISTRKSEMAAIEKSLSGYTDKKLKLRKVEEIETKKNPLTDRISLAPVDYDYLVSAAKNYYSTINKEKKLIQDKQDLIKQNQELSKQNAEYKQKLAKDNSLLGTLNKANLISENKDLKNNIRKYDQFIADFDLNDKWSKFLQRNNSHQIMI